MPALNHDSLMQQLLQTFRDESEDHLRVINAALLQYERSDVPEQRQEAIQSAFRAAHSLKGAARAVSLGEVQKLAHAMETVFQNIRDHQAQLYPTDADRLYDALDLLKAHLNGESPSVTELANLLFQIGGQPPPDAPAIPTPPPVNLPEVDAPPAFLTTEMPVSLPPLEPPPAPVAPVAVPAPVSPTTEVEPAPSVVHSPVRDPGRETIRVSLRKLDDLMAEVGEMLVTRSAASVRQADIRAIRRMLDSWAKSSTEIKMVLKRQSNAVLLDMYTAHADLMQTLIDSFEQLEQANLRDSANLGILTDNLQDKVRRLRMIPFSSQRLHLERAVRETARQSGKQVRFEIVGEHTELDKQVLETLKAPLIHLLGNAVVHGIEDADQRRALGKHEDGYIGLYVQQRGGEVWIHVTDDGRGFDSGRIQAAYQARYGELPSGESVVGLAFAAGVSTAENVSELSGRGVGLDVVNDAVTTLHGRVSVNTVANEGTTITLSVPTSLAITRNLMVRVSDEVYALPLLAVDKLLPIENVLSVGGRSAIQFGEKTIPLVSLAQLLRRSEAPIANGQQNRLALIIAVGDRTLAVSVDDVLTEMELAIKPLPNPLSRVPMVSGVALQASGQPVIVLNPGDFLTAYRSARFEFKPQPVTPKNAPEVPAIQVLVVDDSITTRTLERNILEAAGYDVITATDGQEALNRLQENEDIKIVISDVEMPNLSGLGLTRAIRADAQYQDLPVILVTSRERDEDRQEGMVAGANAYIVKRGFDQTELLGIIDQLL